MRGPIRQHLLFFLLLFFRSCPSVSLSRALRGGGSGDVRRCCRAEVLSLLALLAQKYKYWQR
jgi:hypothetical protein